MATTNKKIISPGLQQKAQEAAKNVQEAPQAARQAESQAEAPELGKARQTAPVAPRATSGNSPGAIMRIRDLLAGGLYRKEPTALEAAIEAIEAVPTLKAHPSVGVYKAEVLDYLRGKVAARDAKS